MIKFLPTFDGYVKQCKAEYKLSDSQIDEHNESYLKLMAKNNTRYLECEPLQWVLYSDASWTDAWGSKD